MGSKIKSIIITLMVILLAFAGGFWLGYDTKANEVKKALSEAFGTNQTQNNTDDIKNKKTVEYKVGQEVVYASQKMKVNSVKTAQTISGQFSTPKSAKNGTKFVLVNISVTNTTDTAFIFEPYTLIDNKNRQYKSYTDSIGTIDDYLDARQIAPSITEIGTVVYEVPTDVKQIKIGNLDTTSNELRVVGIDLP